MLGLWQDLNLNCEEEWECTDNIVRFKKKMENERVFEFLVGLNYELDDVRSRVLSCRLLPSIREVFSEVQLEESKRRVMLREYLMTRPKASALVTRGPHIGSSGSHAGSSPRQSKRAYCEHCKKMGHTKDTCWTLHGKPTDWKPRQPNKAHSHQASTETQADKTPTEIHQSTSSLNFYYFIVFFMTYHWGRQLAVLRNVRVYITSTKLMCVDNVLLLFGESMSEARPLLTLDYLNVAMFESTSRPKSKFNEILTFEVLKESEPGIVPTPRESGSNPNQGFTQTYDIDYTKTFALFDIKNVFLNGELEEEVFITLPPGSCKEEEKFRFNDGRMTILIVYVDDIILTGDNIGEVERLKKVLATEFEVKDLCQMGYFLGMEVAISIRGISISQRNQYMHSPKESHLEAVYKILKYLKGSSGKGLFFKKGDRSVENRRSTTGYCTYVWGNLVTWRSKKAVAQGMCEILWLHKLLEELHITVELPIKLYCDNKTAISISHNHVQHDKTKHIEVDRHFIKEKIENGTICMTYIPTREQLTDKFTKGL
ncbi:hypothetical protein AAG906_022158 [Vitis piasezkii]